MAIDGLEALLEQSKIFALLDREGRDRLAAIAVEQIADGGEVIIREGEAGDAFYVLVEGALDVDAADFGDDTQRVATLTDGAVFGEIAALTREPRTATITAARPSRLLRFEMVAVFGVLKDYPEALAGLNRLGLERTEDLLSKLNDGRWPSDR